MRTRYAMVLAAASVWLGSIACAGQAWGQQKVITPEVDIDQAKLSTYPLRKVLESGSQFFDLPFQPSDGMGEGADGPRAAQRAAFNPNVKNFPFLRLNGLDSQSCFECHNSIGSYHEPGTQSAAMVRKPGATVGAAGFASNLFQNDEFPDPLLKFLRNAPHVFGSGYAQQLASEMSLCLNAQIHAARLSAKASPGVSQSIDLEAKGTKFGSFSTTYNKATGKYSDDFTKVEGVFRSGVLDDDGLYGLAVRPFQFKGIASSLRHFHRDALDFHFSMQAVEKVGVDHDCDKDGLVNEVSTGNVTAIAAFVGMTRVPVQHPRPGHEASVVRGERLFNGQGSTNIPAGSRMCAQCHTPTLTLEDPTFTVEDPVIPAPGEPCPSEAISPMTGKPMLPMLVNPDPPQKTAVNRRFKKLRDEFLDRPEKFRLEDVRKVGPRPPDKAVPPAAPGAFNLDPAKICALIPYKQLRLSGYDIDLTRPWGAGQPSDLPSYIIPRLGADPSGRVHVPIFSDLRTHDMGKGLQDVAPQSSDVMGVTIPPRQFLTRPLWGVADSGPYLHDGRARDLREAILGHALDPSDPSRKTLDPTSEAHDVVAIFRDKLSPAEQDDITEFLRSLRLPIPATLQIHN